MGPCRCPERSTFAARWLHKCQVALNQPVVLGASTPYGPVSTRGLSICVSTLLTSYMYGRASDSGMGPYRFRVRRDIGVAPGGQNSPRAGSRSPFQSTSRPWFTGFHTLRSGIGPRDSRFRRQAVEVVEAWKDLGSVDGTLSFSFAAGPRGYPDRQLSPGAGSKRLSPISNEPTGQGFP